MKKLKMFLAVSAIVVLGLNAVTAGGVGSASFGVTNATIAAQTGTTTLGQSTVVVDQNADVTLALTGTIGTTNAATSVTASIARVDGNLNVESSPTNIVFAVPANTTAPVVFVNLPKEYIGSSYGLNLVGLTNSSTTIMTNPAVTVWKKRLQAPN